MPMDLRRGRPPKTVGEPRTAQFNIRARPSFRAKLAEAAEANQRALSEEAEARIEQSFAFEQLFGDTASADFALLLGATFMLAGRQAAALDGHPEWGAAEWQRDPWCFESAAFAVADVLWSRHPAPGKYFGSFRDNWLRRLFARGAIRCGKTAADDEELQIKLTRADLRREGKLS
jgi:hypothetical protein